MKEYLKKIAVRYSTPLAFIHNLLKGNRCHLGRGNLLATKGVFMEKTSFDVKGTGNKICIKNGLTRLQNCRFVIRGDNNIIEVDSGCKLRDASLFIEDSNGCIVIGKDTIIAGNTHLAVIEGKTITIGERCLFSSNVTLRTGDSHSILNKEGKRINPSKDIIIGNHVWVGNTVIILKGTKVNDNCVVATGSILTGKECPANSIIGGVGGNVLKSEVDWCGERIPFEQ